jgi:hypothetical protein
VLTAGLVALFDVPREAFSGQIVYRLIPFASGLANVVLTYLLARRLFSGDSMKVCFAVAIAGLLPMNLYMSAYVSNEQLHAAWMSTSILLACNLILARDVRVVPSLALGGVLGLALLTKFTSLLLAPVVLFFVAFKSWAVDRNPFGRAVGIAAAPAGVTAAVAGWYYLRNWLHFGKPVVGNWDATGDVTWWEQPGYHSVAYFTHFGESLRHPFFAGFSSFWDGIYSTLWGDGLVAGMIRVATRHDAWNYDYMAVGYLLALPATAVLVVGYGLALREALTETDMNRRCALSMLTALLFVMGFALVRVVISLPYYAQAKAFYAIAVIAPLSLVAAIGFTSVARWLADPRWAFLRPLYFGWIATLFGVFVLTFGA